VKVGESEARKFVRSVGFEERKMSVVQQLLQPDVVWILIPVTGILVGGTLAVLGKIIRHRERMAKIGMGLDPDFRPSSDDSQPDRLSPSRFAR
jgi:hypothetical protein